MEYKTWHNLSWQEVIKKLNSNPYQGLFKKEAESRQKKFRENLLPEEKPLSELKIFLEQFKSPLIYILLIAGFVTLILREYTDSIVIFGAVFLNIIVGYFQENKASQALRKLKKVIKIKTQVIREGNEIQIDSIKLVPGDIIILSPGDKVPADGRIIESHNLKINEMVLTGEWMAAKKNSDILSKEMPLADRDNMVYMGTVIEDGKGRVVVTETGIKTEIGKIAEMLKEVKEEKTPLQKKLAHFSKIIGIIITLIVILIFIGGVITGRDFIEMFIVSVAVAVAAIPEGLPVAMSVILALGMKRILKRKGLVRKLLAAETLGSTSIICSDKTLTLTQGKMAVSETQTFESKISAQDEEDWQNIFKKKASQNQILLMTIATLCNEAFIENPRDLLPLWRIRGRPTDKALVKSGAQVGLNKTELEKKFPQINEIPFNSQNKFIATLHKINKEKDILYVSGAPEKIIELSSRVVKGKEKLLDKKTKKELTQKLEDSTKKGLRIIGVAYKNIRASKMNINNLEERVNNLVFVGFIALKDPLRKEVKEAIAICKKAGIKLVLVTGDHLLTAKAIASEINLKTKKENIIQGEELDKLSDEEFQKRLKSLDVYARVEPRHKLRIIKAWQEKKEIVAMTGDGINDAPALKQADIGVALGSGTDVAKEVSDLVLLTDNFNIIVAAVEEGRVILDNIRKVITYLLSDSFTETILIGASIILGLPLPILPVQILWVNLIEDGLPSVALAFEPKEKDVMEQNPQKKDVSLLTQEMKVIIFIIGMITNLILLGLFFWLFNKFGEENLNYIRTMVFVSITIDSFIYIFSCKSLRKNIWHINLFSNKFLVFAWIVSFIALFAALYIPIFQTLLKTVSLGPPDWLILIGLGIIELILIEITKWYFIIKKSFN